MSTSLFICIEMQLTVSGNRFSQHTYHSIEYSSSSSARAHHSGLQLKCSHSRNAHVPAASSNQFYSQFLHLFGCRQSSKWNVECVKHTFQHAQTWQRLKEPMYYGKANFMVVNSNTSIIVTPNLYVPLLIEILHIHFLFFLAKWCETGHTKRRMRDRLSFAEQQDDTESNKRFERIGTGVAHTIRICHTNPPTAMMPTCIQLTSSQTQSNQQNKKKFMQIESVSRMACSVHRTKECSQFPMLLTLKSMQTKTAVQKAALFRIIE